jgi:hypothetical protein
MRMITTVSLLCLLLSVSLVRAQGRAAQAGPPAAGVATEEVIRVRAVSGIGPRSVVKTPVFNPTAERAVRQPQDWQHVYLQYEVLLPWIDEMAVQFFVLSMQRDPETGANQYSLFRKNISYLDLEGGRDRLRRAEAFLRPAALKRFGRVVAFAAVVSIGGTVVATPGESGIDLPEVWWDNPLVLDNPLLSLRDGYLLDRTETPWSFINYDDADYIR